MESQNFVEAKKWVSSGPIARRLFRIGWLDNQDGVWCMSAAFSTLELVELWNTRDAVADRRDAVLYAIVLHAEELLTPWETSSSREEDDRELTLQFCKSNWTEILRVEREMGFSDEFTAYVVPALSPIN